MKRLLGRDAGRSQSNDGDKRVEGSCGYGHGQVGAMKSGRV